LPYVFRDNVELWKDFKQKTAVKGLNSLLTVIKYHYINLVNILSSLSRMPFEAGSPFIAINNNIKKPAKAIHCSAGFGG
jgi:hypothetical protein